MKVNSNKIELKCTLLVIAYIDLLCVIAINTKESVRLPFTQNIV